ncbi:hypothetical protein ABPG72_000206 [Tetrahymena utriculariae]
MGGGLSKEHAQINEDECNKRYQAILQNFIVEKKVSDKIFGNITIYLYKNKEKVFRLSEQCHYFSNEASMEQAFQTYYKIMESSPCNLLQLHMCRKQVEDSMCSLSFKIYTLFDYVQGTLEDQIQERAKNKQQFKEQELWSLLEQLVSILTYLTNHLYLRTDSIYIVNQINDLTLYKLSQRSVLNIKSNYEDCQKGNFSGRYLPAEGLKHLKEQSPTYTDYEQQDKFALGMIILSAALLENLDQCYDYGSYELKLTILHEKQNQMKQCYTNDLCVMVEQLLSQDDQGFSIQELNQHLSSIQLPCGPRMQDYCQTVKLENPPILDTYGGGQNIQQLNNSINALQNNNLVAAALNQSVNNGAQGNFIGMSDGQQCLQDQNQIYNNSPKNNLQSGNQLINVSTANLNQYPQQLQIQHQHSISNPNEVNIHNNLKQSAIHSLYNPPLATPPQNNNFYNQPLVNTITLNNQPSQQAIISPYGSQPNTIYSPNVHSHQPSIGNMNGLVNLGPNNNFQPQIQLNNNSIPIQNNVGYLANSNHDPNALLYQVILQLSQQLQQQQQLQESYYQPQNQINYSPLRGANIFNQYNMKKQNHNDYLNDLSKSYSPINGIARRKATYQYDDGSYYDGEMVLDYRDGYGKLIFSNKGVYEGTWKMDKMHGKGTLYYPNGDILYEGDWFEDQFNNFGHLFNSKAQYIQQKLDFKDFSQIKNYWLKYEGAFTLDRKQGFGTLYFTNGERYSGDFQNDTIHGYGVYHSLDNESFSGYWEDNILIKRM